MKRSQSEQRINPGCATKSDISFVEEIDALKDKRTLSAQDKLYFYIARREANTAKRNAIKRYNEKNNK